MIGLPEQLIDESSTVATEVDEAIDTSPETSTQKDDKLRCRACSHLITRGRWAIDRGGAFEHRFRNPAGWSFQVGCYAKAPGAIAAGEPTSEHSWFAGYAWRFAICAKCGAHLGWWYTGRDTFAGLIITRLH